MKKLLLALTVLITFSFASCSKTYNCSCEDTNSGEEFETTSYPNTSLLDARSACKDRQSFWQNTTKPATKCTIL
jgi:hypothetical protein